MLRLVVVWNQIRYGDPLALGAVYRHQRQVFPSVLDVPGPFTQLLWEVPKRVYSTFWYDSGWNQFSWKWFWYVPFCGRWLWPESALSLGAEVSLGASDCKALWVCSVIALGEFVSVWVVGAQTTPEEGRLAFIGLPGSRCPRQTLGYERVRLAIPTRFALPIIGLLGAAIAIRYHVVIPYL